MRAIKFQLIWAVSAFFFCAGFSAAASNLIFNNADALQNAAQTNSVLPINTFNRQAASAKHSSSAQANPQKSEKSPSAKTEIKPLEKSDFETFISKGLLKDCTAGLKQFGYDLFDGPPSTFAPSDNIPLSSDYVVGPGDELRISVWGKIEGSWDVSVDRNGNIFLPKLGVIGVAGLSFKEFKNALKKEFAKYYSGFKINITFGSLRSIRVYVVGNARNPGAYTVSSLSTLVNALFASGGPDKNGTMRDIQIKRNGKTEVNFDLYDLLLKGDKSKDIRLLPEDVIFIPPVGPLAAIAGKVKRPSIYELKKGDKLTDLIDMAGGFASTAFRGRVAMQRIFNHRFTDFFEAEMDEIKSDASKNIALQDGDLVKVLPIAAQDSAVNLAGAVVYPGKFGIREGKTTLKEIIKSAGGLLRQASDKAEITRIKISTSGISTERFDINLKNVLSASAPDFHLKANDHVMVKPTADWYLYKMVKVSGEVLYPGVYTVKRGERLSSVLKRAGGFGKRAYPNGIIFTRKSVKEQQQKNLKEIADRLERELLVQGSAKIQTAISSEDIEAKKAEMAAKEKFVSTIKHLKSTGRVYVKLLTIKSLEGSNYDIALENNDSIFIPSKSSVVSVNGAVMVQGSYVYSSGSFKKYIDMAGGYSDYADKGKTFVLKADGSAVRAKKHLFFSTKVGPGDTIVVPEKFSRIAWLREIKDISQIIMNVALTAGVVIKVF